MCSLSLRSTGSGGCPISIRVSAAGGLVVHDLSAVKAEIALALLNSLHEGFGISWDQPAISAANRLQVAPASTGPEA